MSETCEVFERMIYSIYYKFSFYSEAMIFIKELDFMLTFDGVSPNYTQYARYNPLYVPFLPFAVIILRKFREFISFSSRIFYMYTTNG